MISQELRFKIAQMILVGFQGAELHDAHPITKALGESGLGGVILYNIDLKCYLEALEKDPELTREEAARICPKNIVSPGQLQNLTAAMNRCSRTPPLIAVDQEGGMVTRLGPDAGFSERESHRSLGVINDPERTEKVAENIARDLKKSGINLNLAPVVDLDLNSEGLISRSGRSFGPDPERVLGHAAAFIRAHRRTGVLTCLKHFPGKGSAGKDTHFEVADITATYREEELVPFSRLIREGMADAVMTSHIHHRVWDPVCPVSLSPKILRGVLRERLAYDGVIISDDLQMGAVMKQYSLEEACILAVQAGADIILGSNNSPEGDDPHLFLKMFEALAKGVQEKRISSEQIEGSYQRVMSLKRKISAAKGFQIF
jgi:beta-N-acetylhexosaminidase